MPVELLSSIPTIEDPAKTVFEEFREFSPATPAALEGPHHQRRPHDADASQLGFDLKSRAAMLRLLALPEHVIGARRISDFFDEEFFASHFWTMWRTTFAFQNWHSAISSSVTSCASCKSSIASIPSAACARVFNQYTP